MRGRSRASTPRRRPASSTWAGRLTAKRSTDMAGEDEQARRARIAQLARSAAPVLARYAAQVDREASFPAASVRALRDGGLVGLLVPEEYGGGGGGVPPPPDAGPKPPPGRPLP